MDRSPTSQGSRPGCAVVRQSSMGSTSPTRRASSANGSSLLVLIKSMSGSCPGSKALSSLDGRLRGNTGFVRYRKLLSAIQILPFLSAMSAWSQPPAVFTYRNQFLAHFVRSFHAEQPQPHGEHVYYAGNQCQASQRHTGIILHNEA